MQLVEGVDTSYADIYYVVYGGQLDIIFSFQI